MCDGKCKKTALAIGAGLILFLAGIGFSQSVMMAKRSMPRGFMCKACVCEAGDRDCRCEKCKMPPHMAKKMRHEAKKMHQEKKKMSKEGKVARDHMVRPEDHQRPQPQE